MSRKVFGILTVLIFLVEIIVCSVLLLGRDDITGDSVKVNDIVKTVEENFGDTSLYPADMTYSIIDLNGKVLFENGNDPSRTIAEAVKRSNTIMDIMVGGDLKGHVLIGNDPVQRIRERDIKIAIVILTGSVAQVILTGIWSSYLERKIIKPFRELSESAYRVASGDLDTPLKIDKGHIFGSFTEAFDIMRTEIRRARIAEKTADDSRKEMVAKLSHDIRTPVASIKSSAEVGYELTSEEKVKERFNIINYKAEELSVLVNNLFESSVRDSVEITVSPVESDSSSVYEAIRKADYKGRAGDFEIPSCRVFTDGLRLQQAFDNVFANSYKYADTDIEVGSVLEDGYLKVFIRDKGPGVKEDEIAVLKEKYRRGGNSGGKEGAGLGLYLAEQYMKGMDGELLISNEDPGLKVLFLIRAI